MEFFQSLNYSLGNEDWSAEEAALRVTPDDTAICITASGDRPLHLLMTDCKKIYSLDMNLSQNYLLELKLAAIKQLDYEKYLSFLGLTPTKNRHKLFKELTPHLSKEAVSFWEKNKKMISKGVIYQGKVERLTHLGAKFIKLCRNKKNKALLEFDNIEEQREFLKKKWDKRLWQLFFEIMVSPKLSKFVLDDPGFNSYTEHTKNPGKYIYDRMKRYLENNLAKKSALIQLLLTGRVTPDAYFPYLKFEGYTKIRRNPGRLILKTDNITHFLHNAPENSIDCFSLSDIASYMPQEAFENLLQGVLSAAKPGSRFCIREFMSQRNIPKKLTSHFARETDLEKKLDIEESNFVYRFIVGTISKAEQLQLVG